MKPALFIVFILFFCTALYGQKSKSANSPSTQIDSIEKQLQDLTKKVSELKKTLAGGEAETIKKEDTYGYLILKKEAKNTILYTKPEAQSFKASEAYKDYITKKSGQKQDGQSALRDGQTETDSDKNLTIPDDAKYSYVKVDSLFVKIERNQIVSVVLFSGDYPSFTSMNLSPIDIDKGNDYLNYYSNDSVAFIRLRDVLAFIPLYNTDNVKSGVYTLSFAGSSTKVPLQKL